MSSSYSTSLCKYVVSKEQKDLLVIFENFIDNVSDPETNVFFVQNEILDKIMTNIENNKKNVISLDELYEGISEKEKRIISGIDINKKIKNNAHISKILGINYFDEEMFMNVLDEELQNILDKYNLKANDDYNKMHKFLSSIKLILQSSDDVLLALKNQYIFFSEHAKLSKSNDEEVITIYGNRHYKIDILKNLIDIYNKKNSMRKKTILKRGK